MTVQRRFTTLTGNKEEQLATSRGNESNDDGDETVFGWNEEASSEIDEDDREEAPSLDDEDFVDDENEGF
ncbi:hypothetical protein QE152_g25168 [Popillia japonica]|uniref:Uncharacterized protein n=1 Tax=Popillia japonica TaxID=7064 RepID=A0AAW1K2I8_POPJA